MDAYKLSREIVLTLSGSTFYGTAEAAREQQGEIIERYLTLAIAAAREEGRAAGYGEGRQHAIDATRKWAANYPVDIFSEPTGDAPPQSDRWHASWARHTCKQIEREILEFVPAATTEGPK